MAQPYRAMIGRRFRVIHPPEAVIGVHLSRQAGWRLAHPRRGELPIVTGIERRRIENQDRHLGFTPPIIRLWIEVRRFADRLDRELVEPKLLVAAEQSAGEPGEPALVLLALDASEELA